MPVAEMERLSVETDRFGLFTFDTGVTVSLAELRGIVGFLQYLKGATLIAANTARVRRGDVDRLVAPLEPPHPGLASAEREFFALHPEGKVERLADVVGPQRPGAGARRSSDLEVVRVSFASPFAVIAEFFGPAAGVTIGALAVKGPAVLQNWLSLAPDLRARRARAEADAARAKADAEAEELRRDVARRQRAALAGALADAIPADTSAERAALERRLREGAKQFATAPPLADLAVGDFDAILARFDDWRRNS